MVCSAESMTLREKKTIAVDLHTAQLIPLPLTGWAGIRKVKPIWILLKQETACGSGIGWAICKSAPRSRQITTPVPHRSVFYRLDALPATQPTASKHSRQSALIACNAYMPGASADGVSASRRSQRQWRKRCCGLHGHAAVCPQQPQPAQRGRLTAHCWAHGVFVVFQLQSLRLRQSWWVCLQSRKWCVLSVWNSTDKALSMIARSPCLTGLWILIQDTSWQFHSKPGRQKSGILSSILLTSPTLLSDTAFSNI